jgi:hypothetical protein
VGSAPEVAVTPNELMKRLSALRRAQIGGKRAPHKPLLLLWLFGRFAATGSALVPYAEAAEPVSQLINDFGPPVRSPAPGRQRAAMPFVHLERDLWELRDRTGDAIGANVLPSWFRCETPMVTSADAASPRPAGVIELSKGQIRLRLGDPGGARNVLRKRTRHRCQGAPSRTASIAARIPA